MWFWIFFVLAILVDGLIGPALTIGGAVVYYLGQERGQAKLNVGGFALMLGGVLVSFITWFVISTLLLLGGVSQVDLNTYLSIWNNLSIFVSLPFVLLAFHYILKVKRLEKEVFLFNTLRTKSIELDSLSKILREFIDINLGEINIHQKYVETLLMLGRDKDAVVESQRILEIDPYNFGANLLLAHGYLELGLYEECIKVCNNYLAISGYSFEFEDLREQCQMILGEVNAV